jgi:hypothetical protein
MQFILSDCCKQAVEGLSLNEFLKAADGHNPAFAGASRSKLHLAPLAPSG